MFTRDVATSLIFNFYAHNIYTVVCNITAFTYEYDTIGSV